MSGVTENQVMINDLFYLSLVPKVYNCAAFTIYELLQINNNN